MIKPKLRSNLMYGVVAFIFALILFFNANGRAIQSPIGGSTVTTESFEETVNNVRIEALYDDEKYYIHGYNPTVAVKLSSINRIQLNTEANADTRGFQVIADLTGLGEGTHEVKLRIQNMSSAVTGTIEPTKITVTIESRTSAEMPVEPAYSTSNLESGFTIDSVAVNPEKVNITTGSQTLAEIDRLVATVDPTKLTDHNLEETVRVQAMDKEGNVLSVVADPPEVTVNITVTAPQKQVYLYPEQTGKQASNVASYNLSLAENTAIIGGEQSKLDTIESIAVPVDVSGITKETKQKVHVPVESGLTVDPTEVTVTISPRLMPGSSTPSSSAVDSGKSEEQTKPSTTSTSTDEETTTEQSESADDSASKTTSEESEVSTNSSTETTSESSQTAQGPTQTTSQGDSLQMAVNDADESSSTEMK